MYLFNKQRWALRRAVKRLNIWEGSVRSGKTRNIDYAFTKSLGDSRKLCPPDAIDIMVGKTIGSLKRNVINPLCALIGADAHYYPGKSEFHLWDYVIHTIGANDERSIGKIQGSTVRKALGDEIALWPEGFFKMLDTRLSLDSSQFFGGTNPGPPNHYLKKDYLDRKRVLDLASFHFRLEDNTTLSRKYVEEIKKNFTGLWFRRLILGLWCAAEGAIYDFFNEDEHTLVKCPKASYYILGIDYGTSNPFAAGLFGVNDLTQPRIWLEAEYYFDPKKEQRQQTDYEFSNDLKDFCAEYLGKYWQNKLSKVIIDPSAESFEVQLVKDGFGGVQHADNSVIDGLKITASMLKSGMYAIYYKCLHNIEEKYSYSWDSRAQAKGEDKPKKDADHCSDLERYVLQTLYGQSFLDLGLLTRM